MTELDNNLWRIQGWIHAKSGRGGDRKVSFMMSKEKTMSILKV